MTAGIIVYVMLTANYAHFACRCDLFLNLIISFLKTIIHILISFILSSHWKCLFTITPSKSTRYWSLINFKYISKVTAWEGSSSQTILLWCISLDLLNLIVLLLKCLSWLIFIITILNSCSCCNIKIRW